MSEAITPDKEQLEINPVHAKPSPGRFTRRTLLKLTGATIAAIPTNRIAGKLGVGEADSEQKPIPGDVTIPKETSKPPALGKLVAYSTEALKMFKREHALPDTVDIIGFGETPYTYLISSPAFGGKIDIPITDVEILEGEPVSPNEIKISTTIGIRNDDSRLMDTAVQMGMGIVRINGENYNLSSSDVMESKDTAYIKEALQEAKKRNLKILYLFHPHQLESRETIRDRLQSFFDTMGNYNNHAIELGNEPNDPKYWEKGDLKTFVEFLKVASEEAWNINPNAKLLIGALSYTPQTGELLDIMKKKGIEINRFTAIATHAYNNIIELDQKIRDMKRAFGKRDMREFPIIITELGVNGKNKIDQLPKMIERASEQGVGEIYIHELNDSEGWGLANEETRRLNVAGRIVQYYIQKIAK